MLDFNSFTFNWLQMKKDLRWLWDKTRTALINWYVKQAWLKDRAPFVWFEESKMLRAELLYAHREIERLEEQLLHVDESLVWAMNTETLNTSAKTTALWLYSVLHPDISDVSRSTVETAARKR